MKGLQPIHWEGGLRICAGVDPETGYFFVSTVRGMRAKFPQLCYTVDFIDLHYRGVERQQLRLVYHALVDARMTTVLEGVLLFTASQRKPTIIDDTACVTFPMGTVTYAISDADPLAPVVRRASLGIAFDQILLPSGKAPPQELRSSSVGVRVDHLRPRKAWVVGADGLAVVAEPSSSTPGLIWLRSEMAGG